MDSSGLGALVTISKKVRENGGELRLAYLNEDPPLPFELTKLDSLFHILPTVEAALRVSGLDGAAAQDHCPAERSARRAGPPRRGRSSATPSDVGEVEAAVELIARHCFAGVSLLVHRLPAPGDLAEALSNAGPPVERRGLARTSGSAPNCIRTLSAVGP
ncbi:MAG: STAS domain-containing protein [Gemmatimonadales bacterium]